MTPSRKPAAAADAVEDDGAGVLAATPSTDTAGLGLLPTHTEQVRLILPAEDDDDLLDDEVVADEIAGLDDPETEEVEAELVETGPVAAVTASSPHDDEADDDLNDDQEFSEDEESADDDEFADGEFADGDAEDDEAAEDDELAPEDLDDEEPAEDEVDDNELADDEVDDEELAEDEVADDDLDEDENPDDGYELDPDPAPQPVVDAFDALIAAAVDGPAPAPAAPPTTATGSTPVVLVSTPAPVTAAAASASAASDAVPALVTTDARTATPARAGNAPVPEPAARAATSPAPEPAAPVASGPTTGPLDTRWARAHPDDPDRAHAVERVATHREVSLSSRRIGEFEPHRESSDLLTADRLLDPQRAPRPEPEGAWQQFVYALSGRRINLGDGRRARARKELDRRIAAPLPGGARFVPVLSRKGGVGKTTVTTLVGMALADARDDRIIAIDANPDRGTLAERFARTSGRTVRDLVRRREQITDYHELSSIVARDDTRLDVLSSDADPGVSEAFSDRDYEDVAAIAAHYYSIVLTDTGTGVVHSVMGATLDLADQLVVVAGLSVDEARLASETLTWLETNGYTDRVRNAVVVLNNSRPGSPMVRRSELETHFRSRVRAVVQLPYDPSIAAGSAITFRDLQSATREAAREIAAEVVAGLQQVASAA